MNELESVPYFKRLNIKVSALIIVVILIAFYSLHWRVMQYLEQYTFDRLDLRLTAQLENIDREMVRRNDDNIYLVRTLATDLNLRRALDRGSNRGVNQSLNRAVEIYPRFRYLLLVDQEGEIFSSSTRNKSKEKTFGETLLGLTYKDVPTLGQLLKSSPTSSPPFYDPLAPLLGIPSLEVQWYTAPIKKKGDVIGWLIVCYDWQLEVGSLFDSARGQLSSAGESVLDLALLKGGGRIVSSGNEGNVLNLKDLVYSKIPLKSIAGEYELQITVDDKETLVDLSLISRSLMMFFVFTGGVIFIFLYLITNVLVTRRVSAIEKGAENIRAGNIDYRVEYLGHDEIGLLGATINEMAYSMAKTWGDLEEKVRDRTHKLHDSYISQKKQTSDLIVSEKELKAQTLALKRSNSTLAEQKRKLRDSEEKLTEKQRQLLEQAAVLKDANISIRRKARDLEEASRYKTEFLANITHELRTPLNSMLVLSKSLTKNKPGNLTDTQLKDVALIHEGGENLLALIDDIMDLTKIESGDLIIRPHPVVILDLARALKNHFLSVSAQTGLPFVFEVSEELPPLIQSDGQRIEHILKNILSNAFKYSQHGEVKLKIFPFTDEGEVHSDSVVPEGVGFSVIDSGIGIQSDQQEAIFVAFQQEDGSISRQYGGAGLGLSIASKLTTLLKGKITLESTVGVGSTFTIYLPMVFDESNDAISELVFGNLGATSKASLLNDQNSVRH